MKSLLLLPLAATAMLFTACKNDDEPKQAEPQNILVSFDLGNGLRAAMTDGQDAINADKTAKVENIDVYLMDASGVLVSKRFNKNDPEFTQLTSTPGTHSDLIADGNNEGYKFTSVPAGVTRVFAIVNPQDANVKGKGDDVMSLVYSLKSQANEAVYADFTDNIVTLNPETDGTLVKKAELHLKGNMNRFQVVNKFSKIVKADTYEDAFNAWKATRSDLKGKSEAFIKVELNKYLKDTFAGANGYNQGNPTEEWKKWFKVEDITANNTGIFMNRFDLNFNPFTKDASTHLYAQRYNGVYTTTDGAYTINGSDIAEVASYFKAGGFTLAMDGKVAAFNFFYQNVKSYNENGNAPKIHFYIKDVPAANAFVNLVGYQNEDGSELNVSDLAKGGQLINIDLKKINDKGNPGNGDGIIVISEDPNVPGGGHDDIDKLPFNLRVRVTVEPWVAVNVKPIVQ